MDWSRFRPSQNFEDYRDHPWTPLQAVQSGFGSLGGQAQDQLGWLIGMLTTPKYDRAPQGSLEAQAGLNDIGPQLLDFIRSHPHPYPAPGGEMTWPNTPSMFDTYNKIR